VDVTISLDDETERWVRGEAARRGESVSAFVDRIVRDALGEGRDYASAMRRYRSRPAQTLSTGRYPNRDELYNR
jgi:hypothetical protein